MFPDEQKREASYGDVFRQWARVLTRYAAVWIVPAVVITTLAAAYAFFRTSTWQATQALIVRNEAIGTEDATGRFSQADQMKTVEETILEVLYSRDVLRPTLKNVGPAPGQKGPLSDWPTPRDVEDFRADIGLDPPEGAEFGSTEVLYLSAKSTTPQHSAALVGEMFKQLEAQLRKIRNAKAKSIVAELVRASELARKNLDESTSKLAEIEKNVGADLSELRTLSHIGGNESNLERTIVTIESELRNAEVTLRENETLIELLENAEGDTERLLATPNRLLESQPSLHALKNGLIAAQLKTAEMQGRMLDTHPEVEAALEAERATRDSLHRELKAAILGLKNNVVHEKNRIDLLESQRADNVARLEKLAAMRATYANLVQENENRSTLLQKADEQLAKVQAHQENTLSINLIEPIGVPEPGARPLGPSRSMILAAGLFGGLFAGLGLLLLVVPVNALRACTTYQAPATLPTQEPAAKSRVKSGRRASDRYTETPKIEIVPQLPTKQPEAAPTEENREKQVIERVKEAIKEVETHVKHEATTAVETPVETPIETSFETEVKANTLEVETVIPVMEAEIEADTEMEEEVLAEGATYDVEAEMEEEDYTAELDMEETIADMEEMEEMEDEEEQDDESILAAEEEYEEEEEKRSLIDIRLKKIANLAKSKSR